MVLCHVSFLGGKSVATQYREYMPVDDSKYLVNELKSSLIDCRLGLGSTGTVKDKFCALQEAMAEL